MNSTLGGISMPSTELPVKASLNDDSISLQDVFMGSLPFAAIMLLVTLMVIAMPWMATAFVR